MGTNETPKNGLFARVMPGRFAKEFIEGREKFSVDKEAFFTAFDDIKNINTPKGLAERVWLQRYPDKPILRNDADTICVFKKSKTADIKIPKDDTNKREYGYIPGGRTKGGAREWVMENGNIQQLQKNGFEIDHIYQVDNNGGKQLWTCVVNQDGTYTVKNTSMIKLSETSKNLESNSKNLQSEIGNEPSNAKSVTNIGGKNMKLTDTENIQSCARLPLMSSNESSQKPNLDKENKQVPIENDIRLNAGEQLASIKGDGNIKKAGANDVINIRNEHLLNYFAGDPKFIIKLEAKMLETATVLKNKELKIEEQMRVTEILNSRQAMRIWSGEMLSSEGKVACARIIEKNGTKSLDNNAKDEILKNLADREKMVATSLADSIVRSKKPQRERTREMEM